jgi:hypothetical protein
VAVGRQNIARWLRVLLLRVDFGAERGISLQSRLRGGGSGIRTRVTVLNPATRDVCVTCRRYST